MVLIENLKAQILEISKEILTNDLSHPVDLASVLRRIMIIRGNLIPLLLEDTGREIVLALDQLDRLFTDLSQLEWYKLPDRSSKLPSPGVRE